MKRIVILLGLVALFSCARNVETGYTVPDPEDVAMYQVNPRLYAAENSFKAFTTHIDSIRTLGMNVVWFMPICEIGRDEKAMSSPYCVKDYKNVNPEYGTLDDFRNLVAKCHEKGLSVIMDWVANHTSWDNNWITEHPEWYTHNEDGEIIFPENTNWADVADLDFDNPEMRAAMIDAMKFWIEEVGVDGFRCDAADFVPFDFWKECVSALRAIPDRKLLLLAEGQRKDHFEAGFDMNYAWGYIATLRSIYGAGGRRGPALPASALIDTDAEEYDSIPAGCVKLRFTTNHDETSKMSPIREFAGERGSMAAFVASTFIHGGALIYDSQEVGYPGRINFFRYVPVDWQANSDLFQEYCKLMSLYNEYPAIRKGAVVPYPDNNVLMFGKVYSDNSSFLVCVNVRQERMAVKLPVGWAGQTCQNMMTGKEVKLGETLALDPFEYLILK